MKTFIVIALLAQIALVLSLPQGYNPYFQFRGLRLRFRQFSPFGFTMSVPSLTGRETVTFDITIDQRIPGQAPKKLTYQGQADWARRWTVNDYNVQLNGGDKIYVVVSVKNEGQESKFEYDFFVTEYIFENEDESFEARPQSIKPVSPQTAQTPQTPQPQQVAGGQAQNRAS